MAKQLDKKQLERALWVKEHAIEFIETYYHPIKTDPSKTFGQVAERWQYEYFLEPFFDPYIEIQYNETSRDWDKSGLMGASAFAERYFDSGTTRVHSGDREQAEIILDSIRKRILNLHPELKRGDQVVDEKYQIKINTPMAKSILTNEATGKAQDATGKDISRLIYEEMHCCSEDADRELWYILASKGGTRKTIITNPGAKRQGLCWDVRTDVKKRYADGDPRVYFFSAERFPFLPSWLIEDDIMSRPGLPDAVKRRFFKCQWGEGGDVFTEQQILACMRPNVFYLKQLLDIPTCWGLDYGPVANWTALAGCYGSPEGAFKIHKKIWQGSKGSPVQIDDVEDYIRWVSDNFNMSRLDAETYQMVSTIQKLKREFGDARINEWTPTEGNVIAVSKNIYQLVSNGRFGFPDTDEDFANEMRNAELVPASGRNGTQKDDYKIKFRDAGSEGHGDDFRATAIALLNCTQFYTRRLADIAADIMVGRSTSMDKYKDSPLAILSGEHEGRGGIFGGDIDNGQPMGPTSAGHTWKIGEF